MRSNALSSDVIAQNKAGSQTKEAPWVKIALIGIAITYLGLVLFLPAINVFIQAFRNGVGPFFANFSDAAFINAIQLTVLIALIVVPINTVFGLCAAWAITRHKFPGRALVVSIIDLPFAVSPVVAGLMLILLYGRSGWLGPSLEAINVRIIFALPAMIIASAFITMPFVAREVIPVLEEAGTDQEEAAKTLGAKDWQIFWRVTLPNIRWGLLYGVILTNARVMGEFGAVSVVSGNIIRKTQTLPLYVEEAYKQYESQAAFAASVLLACLALVTLVLKEILERKTSIKDVEE
ncbi:sulfate ABC transporter permease subunit CysW [Gloeocapsopsis crepidinum LEGE 06123]|uniref:Sulfate ABC transporter permease subunit CysW n=1 Tax=Gloeocapsopsis crepidinum LEGE 06123 TaxID=588587 RepID=A0ABR9UUD6_9CHRO|nr:sulfate ABC transporter permease subunit CysW [Gloeocapsopsis crepidinum]MBE9191884.1 sulfate ABC transporter permease subunit CysW [Gloeocapsopsis crepidinum LEGE 06123]